METENSLYYSQSPATRPYPEPDQSTPCLPIPPLEESHVPFPLFTSCQMVSLSQSPCEMFRNIGGFYDEEYHPLLAVRECLFSVFAADLQQVGTKCLLGEYPALSTEIGDKIKPATPDAVRLPVRIIHCTCSQALKVLRILSPSRRNSERPDG